MAGKAAPKKDLSTLKRARQAEKHGLRNQSAKTKIKTFITKLETALPSKNKDDIDKILKETIKTINSAASKGIIHKNTASRKISRITTKANAALSA
ncbi:MAG: 30S ribosomal protein S20 [Nitrospirae bacterium]|nr:30S ribosomal protein S20 [Nitrospirota bacterium]MCL5063172.1 30S ribosomal protein S20 [Nitrospirota bacterium]MDA8214723.1 30S ribosomal protein S20 [Nitrospiraceae bacterium]MDA8340077.1 30S ribosomal protein S20 [Nitrospiraceae bacterium]